MAVSWQDVMTAVENKTIQFWARNGSIGLMVVAQLISSLMAVTVKLLQTHGKEGGRLDARQVLITMMSVTVVLSWLWMFCAEVPHAPFGPRKFWPLLTIRGIAGVLGIWGFYYSLRYLPISEATVINFLSPMVAITIFSIVSRAPPTATQLSTGLVSLIGVILVSQPWQMFTETPPKIDGNSTACNACTGNAGTHGPSMIPVTSLQRIAATGAALAGVAGGAAAYVAMSLIGKDVHPVVTVHHFSAWTVLLTSSSFVITGFDAFGMPSLSAWSMLAFLGTFALLLHILIATSLQGEGGTRALNVVYTQILFALIMDKAVWGVSPSWLGLMGGTLILGSVVTVAIVKEKSEDSAAVMYRSRTEVRDEEEMETMIGKSNDEEQ